MGTGNMEHLNVKNKLAIPLLDLAELDWRLQKQIDGWTHCWRRKGAEQHRFQLSQE